MSKVNVIQFFGQVRQEIAKVTWPTRKETGVTTVMVFIMVFVASLFFLGVDKVLSSVVHYILGWGN
jgi:preprotein translocase subunit SecE